LGCISLYWGVKHTPYYPGWLQHGCAKKHWAYNFANVALVYAIQGADSHVSMLLLLNFFQDLVPVIFMDWWIMNGERGWPRKKLRYANNFSFETRQ
jgi:hypothetical protein